MTTASQSSSRRFVLRKSREAFAADLLLAFDDERQIARQRRAGFEMRLDGLEMREVLAFVVGASRARKFRAANDARLKRRRCPQIQRLRRLHVVMAINHVMRSAVGRASPRAARRRFGHNNWMAFGRTDLRVEADLPAMSHQPLRAGAHILFMTAAAPRRWAAGDSRRVRPRSGPGFVSDNRAPIAWPRDYRRGGHFPMRDLRLQNRSEIILA